MTDLEPWPDDVVAIAGEKPDPIVSTTALADLLGIGPTRLNTLVRGGIIPCDGRGGFPLRAAVRAYCHHLREAKRQTKTVSPEMEAARLRAANAQAEKAEIANAKARGELLDASRVRSAWTRTVLDLRAAVLAMPQRIAANLGLDRRAAQALDVEIREALMILSLDNSEKVEGVGHV